MAIVLFHGSFNSYDQINQLWLPKLLALQQKIIFPCFPTDSFDDITRAGIENIPKKQSLDSWLEVFETYLEEIKGEKELVFVGHSTGPLFILRVLQKYKIKIKSAVFVCPFINPLTKPSWQVKLINESYFSNDIDFVELKKLCPKSVVLYGTDDPYVETENTLLFANKMGSVVTPIEGGGHLNKEGSSSIVVDTCKNYI